MAATERTLPTVRVRRRVLIAVSHDWVYQGGSKAETKSSAAKSIILRRNTICDHTVGILFQSSRECACPTRSVCSCFWNPEAAPMVKLFCIYVYEGLSKEKNIGEKFFQCFLLVWAILSSQSQNWSLFSVWLLDVPLRPFHEIWECHYSQFTGLGKNVNNWSLSKLKKVWGGFSVFFPADKVNDSLF